MLRPSPTRHVDVPEKKVPSSRIVIIALTVVACHVDQAQPFPPSPGMTATRSDRCSTTSIRCHLDMLDMCPRIPSWSSTVLTKLLPHIGHLQVPGCRPGQHPRRLRWDGCPRQPRSLHRAVEARSCWGYRGERLQQAVLPYVISPPQPQTAAAAATADSTHIREPFGLTRDAIVSGGFAVVQPGSKLSINAVEGYPLEDFSAEAVRAQIAEAQKIVSGGGSQQDIAEAQVELEVSPARRRDGRGSAVCVVTNKMT